MRLTIFGLAGRTGRLLVQTALDAGHRVVALAPNPDRLNIRHAALTVIQGDVLQPERVARAVVDADAVLCALGSTPSSEPWALTLSMEHILAAMKQHDVRRLVCLGHVAVPDPRDRPTLGSRVAGAIGRLFRRRALEDALGAAEAIRRSDRDWTLVRAPRLVDGPRTGRYRVGYLRLRPRERVTRADVAEFMLQQLTDEAYIRQAPMIIG